ncbi:MAG: cytochrome c oxidase assembly protein [Anaerolineae bacterium]|nr:cytochrome c oxidase assembly protein [Anaerolineae bacterium]
MKKGFCKSIFFTFVYLYSFPLRAQAHGGSPHTPGNAWSHWNGDPLLIGSMAIIVAAYLLGSYKIWQRSGFGRGLGYGHVAAFLAGMWALMIALVSPLDGLAEELFSAHMAQHLLLMLVAPPLIVWSRPIIPLLWALSRPARHTTGSFWRKAQGLRWLWHHLTNPLVVWGLYALTLWLWHIPRFYQAALESETLHQAEHLSFLAAAILFWWLVLQPVGHRRLDYGAAFLFIFTTMLHSGALGAFLTFARVPLYPIYLETTAIWGMTPLEDQQLAGLLMWTPPTLIYVVIGLALLGVWINRQEKNPSGELQHAPVDH